MHPFHMTSDEWNHVQETFKAWSDTLIEYEDRQCTILAHSRHGGTHRVCALGALDLALGNKPGDYESGLGESTRGFLQDHPFLIDLVGETAARQNDISDVRRKMGSWSHRYLITYLNDVERLPFVSFASAVNATLQRIAEHIVIEDETPAPTPDPSRELVEV